MNDLLELAGLALSWKASSKCRLIVLTLLTLVFWADNVLSTAVATASTVVVASMALWRAFTVAAIASTVGVIVSVGVGGSDANVGGGGGLLLQPALTNNSPSNITVAEIFMNDSSYGAASLIALL